jgi:hypothetical protein
MREIACFTTITPRCNPRRMTDLPQSELRSLLTTQKYRLATALNNFYNADNKNPAAGDAAAIEIAQAIRVLVHVHKNGCLTFVCFRMWAHGNAGTRKRCTPESQRAFARLLAQGWTDAMRKLNPDGPLWTFWDYKFERWQKDKGLRLDHFLLSPKVSDQLVDGGVDRWARGQENASDHAPTWILLDL